MKSTIELSFYSLQIGFRRLFLLIPDAQDILRLSEDI